LASNTKKRERKTVSSLVLFSNLIIIIIVFIITFGVAVPSPRVFYHKRRIYSQLRDLKAHRRAYFALVLFQTRKPLAHLLVRFVDKSVIAATGGEGGGTAGAHTM
jgi:hypothetical protein